MKKSSRIETSLLLIGAVALIAFAIRKMKRQKYYCFDVSKVEPGDVVLSTRPFSMTLPGLKSFLIRRITGSRWSHVAIVSEEKNIIEAVGQGVRRLSILFALVDARQNVKVLRLLPRCGGPELAKRAAQYASYQVSHEYASFKALINSVCSIPLLAGGPEANEHFCSHLVASSFSSTGLSLFPGKTDEKIVPNDFDHAGQFLNVTSQVLVEAPRYARSIPFLEFGESTEIAEAEMTCEQEVVKQVRNALGGDNCISSATTFREILEEVYIASSKEPDLANKIDIAFLSSLRRYKWLELANKLSADSSAAELSERVEKLLSDGALSFSEVEGVELVLRRALMGLSNGEAARQRNKELTFALATEINMQSAKYLYEYYNTLSESVRIRQATCERLLEKLLAIKRYPQP